MLPHEGRRPVLNTVLICDDNAAVHKSLEEYLKERGLNIVSVYRGMEALEAVRAGGISLAVLDVMLPDLSGLEVLRTIRKLDGALPVLLLSARGEELDRVLGLELGADDYVVKPFSPREVALRICKLLDRRSGVRPDRTVRFAALQINLDSYETDVNGTRIPLSPRETELLAYLVDNAGKVISRELLLNAVWGTAYIGDPRVVDTQIKRIRRKLSEVNAGCAIRSVYGVGYKLEAAQDA